MGETDTKPVLETGSTETPGQLTRDQIVNTAVKFLQNERVRGTSLDLKKKFLEEKGLTVDEIQVACSRAGAFEQNEKNSSLALMPAAAHLTHLVPHYGSPSWWVKLREVANLVALLSIGSYGLYALWTRFVLPKLFGRQSCQEKNYRDLVTSIAGLNASVVELKKLMEKVYAHQLESRAEKQVSNSKKTMILDSELKNELSSIKALLLNRNQFPASPGIPSWQLVNVEKENGEELRDDSPGSNPPKEEDKDPTTEDVALERQGSSSGSRDSIALHSDSSCEVVLVGGKQDSSEHSDN